MGKNNQQRRAAKRRREQRHGVPPRGRGPWRPETSVRLLLVDGARFAFERDRAGISGAVQALARAAQTSGRKAIGTALSELFCLALGDVWEGGWQPVEVARVARRRRSADHEQLVATAMAAWTPPPAARPPAPWAAQLDALGVTRWWGPADEWLEPWALRAGMSWDDALGVGLETLGEVMALPVIERMVPPPSQWLDLGPLERAVSPDDPVLAKIRALLAKAESTSFEAESEALTAKAQELMARHAIDDALARTGDARRHERPIGRRVPVDDPYASAKSALLSVVARANGARCVWYDAFAMMAIVGFEADLDAIEVLFTSLLVQGTKAMLAHGSVADHRGRSRTRSFRQSFLMAFASRIGERLATAAGTARAEAEQELHRTLLPVLARRDDEVGEALTAMFPRLSRRSGLRSTNQAGWVAGRTAAELATLGPPRPRLTGTASP